jgi:hypothetical protein
MSKSLWRKVAAASSATDRQDIALVAAESDHHRQSLAPHVNH